MKYCLKCNIEKPQEAFHKSSRAKNGLRPYCKLCIQIERNTPEAKAKRKEYNDRPERKAKRKEYNARPEIKERLRLWELKRKYGISQEDYKLLLNKQNDRCDICQISFLKVLPCIDHDHKTGKVRGILCNLCNSTLGSFKDNPTAIKAAINYLKENNNE